MTDPQKLHRRAFLQVLAAAPAAAQKAAEEAVGAFPAAAPIGHALDPPAPVLIGTNEKLLQLVAMWKSGLLPDWARRQIRRNSSYERRLDPDVASLRSVSLANKIRISRERQDERQLTNLETEVLDNMAQRAFMGWDCG